MFGKIFRLKGFLSLLVLVVCQLSVFGQKEDIQIFVNVGINKHFLDVVNRQPNDKVDEKTIDFRAGVGVQYRILQDFKIFLELNQFKVEKEYHIVGFITFPHHGYRFNMIQFSGGAKYTIIPKLNYLIGYTFAASQNLAHYFLEYHDEELSIIPYPPSPNFNLHYFRTGISYNINPSLLLEFNYCRLIRAGKLSIVAITDFDLVSLSTSYLFSFKQKERT
jgi:hypothetical protein